MSLWPCTLHWAARAHTALAGRLASVHVVRAGAGPGRGASEASEATRSQLCVERRMERGHAG